METQFATAGISAAERFDYWHELVYRIYAPCAGRVGTVEQFAARLQTYDFGSAEISDVESTGICYERRPYDLRVGPRDDLFVSLMVSGETRFTQCGREVVQRDGDVLLYDAGRVYCYDYDRDYRSLLVRVPRPLLASRGVDIDKFGGRILEAGTPMGQLVGSLVTEAHKVAKGIDRDSRASFLPPMLDMISAAVRQSMGDAPVDNRGNRAILERIKQYVVQNLADGEMTLFSLAKTHNVSTRTLSRLFAEGGATPMGWVQEQRLKHAYAALAERRVRSVTEAALEYGFKDLSHFSRSFKQKFGTTPKKLFDEVRN